MALATITRRPPIRIRRAVAAVATTAVVAPVALLAAPAAYAGEPSGPDRIVPQAESAPGSDEKALVEERPAEASPAEESPAEESPAEKSPAEESPAEEGKPGDEERGEQCEAVEESDGVTATVNGVPEQIYSGSGWEDFSLTVTNHTDASRQLTSAHLWKNAFTESLKDATRYVRLQAEANGTWTDVSKEDGSDDSGLVGWSSLAAGETAGVELRIRVDRAPASLGVAMGYAFHVAGDNTCAEKVGDVYLFNIIPGSEKPNGNDAEPQGGTRSPEKPTDVETGEAPGQDNELAATGSDANLPMFGLAGAAAVALGAGATFLVRRRKGADTAA